jgi:dienelactone hydrolase
LSGNFAGGILPKRTRLLFALTVAFVAIAGGFLAQPYVRGLSFVIRAADRHGIVRRLADVDAGPIQERLIEIPLPTRTIRARVYEPAGTLRRTALLIRGLTPTGYDDPRLVSFARQLARSGVAVVTPEIPELTHFSVTPAITDAIEESALWLASDPRLAPDQRIGLMGVSFSGGLSLVAAGRPRLRGRLAYVFSFGGHDDLPRVLRYLSTGVVSGEVRIPHEYGVTVVLLGVLDRLVPPDQLATLREVVLRYLRAADVERTDKAGADSEFAELQALAAGLPEPSRTILDAVNRHDVSALGARMLPVIDAYGNEQSLSVSRSPKPSAPVFLLHGAEDRIIPAEESISIAANFRDQAHGRILITKLISHAEADQPASLRDVLDLASFWADLLDR